MKRTVIALTLTLAITAFAQSPQPKSPQWEYKIDYKVTEKHANDLALDGWELVGAGSANAGTSSVSFLIFKRAK